MQCKLHNRDRIDKTDKNSATPGCRQHPETKQTKETKIGTGAFLVLSCPQFRDVNAELWPLQESGHKKTAPSLKTQDGLPFVRHIIPNHLNASRMIPFQASGLEHRALLHPESLCVGLLKARKASWPVICRDC